MEFVTSNVAYQSNRRMFREIERGMGWKIIRAGRIRINHSNLYEASICMIFCDGLKLFQTVLYLWRRGHLEAAIILTRSLFERAVDALYMSKDTSARAARYARFGQVSGYKFLQDLRSEFGPSDAVREKQFQELEKDVTPYLRYYGGRHWSGNDIYQRAKAVGLVRHYRISHAQYCEYAHSDPSSAVRSVKLLSTGGLECRYAPRTGYDDTDYMARFVMTESAKYTMLLLAVFSSIFRLGLTPALNGAIDKLRANEDFSQCFQANRVLWRKK